MVDTQFVEKVRIALQLAQEEAWDHAIPTTTMRLGIMLRMVGNRFPVFWNEEADILAGELLTNSPELALKLDEFDALTLGFAMRTHRFVRRAMDKNPSPKPDRRSKT